MVMTPPIVLVALGELGVATLFSVKIEQSRPLISAISKSRKTVVRPALPDAVNRAEGSFMTPALYPAPRSQGGRGLLLCRKPTAEAEGECRPQRLTAGQTTSGVSQPRPDGESRIQGEEPPKKRGFFALNSVSRCQVPESLVCGETGSSVVTFLGLGTSVAEEASVSLQM